MDTFSANSLKLLQKDPEAFRAKYIDNITLIQDNSKAKAGQNLHSYLSFYLKDFDTSKFEASLSKKDLDFIEKIKTFECVRKIKSARTKENKEIEQPFFVKCKDFYLTGRFDAVLKINPKAATESPTARPASFLDVPESPVASLSFSADNYRAHAAEYQETPSVKSPAAIEIYDWKTQNLPQNIEKDIQTVVYLFAASKLYKTENITITYVSLTKNETGTAKYDACANYEEKIAEITANQALS